MEEEKEFETFKRGRGKTLCHIWNLYPYSSVTNPIYLGKLRRGQSSQTPLFKKAKKEASSPCIYMYKASVTKYNRVSLPSWEGSIKRSTYQGNATIEAANWLFGNLQRPQRVFGSLLRDFTGHTWWFRRGRGTRNSICFPMCLYRSLLSHQPQSRLSQWKPYGNTPSQTQQRRMTYRILWLSGSLPLHSETE